MTDDPVNAFLLLLPMKMMMVTISTKKMDDNDTEVDNNYDIQICVFAPINRKSQKNPKSFNLDGKNA